MQIQFLKRQLPAPALTEWLNAYNAAQSLGSEHNDAVKSAWAEVYKGWERPAGKPMYQRRKVKKADKPIITDKPPDEPEVEKMDPGPSDVHVPTVPRQWRRRRKLVVRFDEVGSTGLKVTKADEKKLYVFRPLLNGDDLHDWAKAQGLESALPADDMHCTICYSKKSVDWDRWQPDDRTLTIEEGNREIELFDEGAMVLHFDAPALHERWQEFRDGGASYDYDEYKPHVTITYNGPRELPEPYTGPLVFGPEEFREINGSYEPGDEETLKGDYPGHPFRGNQWTAGDDPMPLQGLEERGHRWSDLVPADYNDYLDAVMDPRRSHLGVGYNEWVRRGRPKVVPERDAFSTMWENTMKHLEHIARGSYVEYDLRKDDLDIQDLAVCKLDDDQHIVYGWASVVTVKGEPVIDHQGDIITPATIEKAATEFMKDVRAHGNMHRYAWVIKADDSLERELIKVGTVVHSWPFTHELNKLMGIVSPYEGWSVGVYVTDPPIWKMYKDGTLKGFSIGGRGAFEEITKTLGAGASASDWIHDFVHSTNPRFRGKSKKERIRMALGAYYGNKRFDNAEIEKIAAEIEKGDKPGHPFRGNQWTDDIGGSHGAELDEEHERVARRIRGSDDFRSPYRSQNPADEAEEANFRSPYASQNPAKLGDDDDADFRSPYADQRFGGDRKRKKGPKLMFKDPH